MVSARLTKALAGLAVALLFAAGAPATRAQGDRRIEIFDAHLHYNQEPNPFYSLDKVLYAIRSVVPNFRGIAIFDNDGQSRNDERQNELATVYWKKYELECYFVTPKIFESYVSDYYAQSFGELFRSSTEQVRIVREIVQGRLERFLKEFFHGNIKAYEEYQSASPELRRVVWDTITANRKMSQFADDVFRDYAEHAKQPILLSKGGYYQMIRFLDPESVNPEIVEKLDLIVQYLAE